MLDDKELIEATLARREKRNERDRLARKFLSEHPEVKDDPDGATISSDQIPDGTSEAAIRSIARHYSRQKNVRQLIREMA